MVKRETPTTFFPLQFEADKYLKNIFNEKCWIIVYKILFCHYIKQQSWMLKQIENYKLCRAGRYYLSRHAARH